MYQAQAFHSGTGTPQSVPGPWQPKSQQERVRRTFAPNRSSIFGVPPLPSGFLVKYSPKYQYSRLMHRPEPNLHWRPRMNTMVIQLHGIATSNSSTDPAARTAAGVFFDPNCQFNTSATPSDDEPRTNNRAVLLALNVALDKIIAIRCGAEVYQLDPRYKEVVLMTNSGYLKKSLSYWVWRWVQNGWRNTRGDTVKNADLIQACHQRIVYMETMLKMDVRFWKVNRSEINGADSLAQHALGA